MKGAGGKHDRVSPHHSQSDSLLTDVLYFQTFDSCPDFDFEPCYWIFAQQAGLDPVAAQMIHAAFDRMPQTFPAALSALAAVEDAMQPVGMVFPRALIPTLKKLAKIAEVVAAVVPEASSAGPARLATQPGGHEFDVAVSFAGSERTQAETLAAILKKQASRFFTTRITPTSSGARTVALDRIYVNDAGAKRRRRKAQGWPPRRAATRENYEESAPDNFEIIGEPHSDAMRPRSATLRAE